jgi:hypothetical protein
MPCARWLQAGALPIVVTILGENESTRSAGTARARRVLGRSLVVSIVALGCGLAGTATAAEPPSLTIESPSNGSAINTQTPAFNGTTTDEADPIIEKYDPLTVNIYAGITTEGNKPIGVLLVPEFTGHEWRITAPESLPPGPYTAQAVQNGGRSAPVTFTVDTTPPVVTITAPTNGSTTHGESQPVSGTAGTAPGDRPTVTITLFAGPIGGSQPALAALSVPAPGGSWSGVFGGLQPGIYTARATQEDTARNIGLSEPITFTVLPSSSPSPTASFSWFPPAPVVGQSVVLVSASTDAASPITAFAWDLAGNGPFRAAGPVLTTSFATAGSHVVRLRVADARGASSVATETIPVSLPPLRPMQPFPIVRIAGVETATGVKLSLLSVQAPVGARVTVTCRGRGCRMKPQSRLATASKHARHASSVVLAFRRLERSFPAGATLEVRVSAAGELGKYTLFAIHRHRLPTRVDSCLSALDPQPVACST